MASGKIEVIVGPMFAGKTTLLLERLAEAQKHNKSTTVIKHAKDNRYCQGVISTHDGKQSPAICCRNLAEMIQCSDAADIVFLDETHFFPEINEFADWVLQTGKTLVTAGLHATQTLEGFEGVLQLMAKADVIVHRIAICDYCGEDAPFVARVTPVIDGNLIGGKKDYKACCRTCHDHLRRKPKN